jgi:3-oxoacyl-[acyl-carrier protein] reductase
VALAREGVAVTLVARTREPLEATAEEIRAATRAAVTAVVGDITTDSGVRPRWRPAHSRISW